MPIKIFVKVHLRSETGNIKTFNIWFSSGSNALENHLLTKDMFIFKLLGLVKSVTKMAAGCGKND